MNITDIYTSDPGSRFLVACSSKDQERMVDDVCSSMPANFKARTLLNAIPISAMDIAPDDDPNSFKDLLGLCAKLISAAGKRSHFEGLLLLNVSALTSLPDNYMRLNALGEFLAMKEGLASRCVTLLYGPEKERELLVCADHLDFDGKLKVIRYEQPNRLSIDEILSKSALRYASQDAQRLLESTLEEMSGYDGFNATKFIRTCGNNKGFITERAISELLHDPYSYINRIKKAGQSCSKESATRKIGFQAVSQSVTKGGM